jgi:hypothetical protein
MPRKTSKNSKSKKTTKTFKSPFATMFNTGIKKGVPCGIVMNTIAIKTKKSPTVIGQSLFKAGLVWRQKINSQWIYWAKNGKKTINKNINNAQVNLWQCFIDWCIASGVCTPMQVAFKTGNTKNFTKNCSMWVNKFFTANGITTGVKTTTGTSAWKNTWTKSKKRSTTGRKTSKSHKAWKKNSWTSKHSNNGTYKFPMFKNRTTSKKYRAAA